ncbi:hypothetical protein DFS34DRAFT_622536 [Phlyctochytrium arcticum]|nr:hypothetical protein DFS34DRAFT_622536 [Phlyctochytrium arcticum]
MLHSIYLHQMGKFYDCAQAAMAWLGPLAPAVESTLRKNMLAARSFTPMPATTTDGVVVSSRTARQYTVFLPTEGNSEGQCSCEEYQLMGVPCAHACAFAHVVRQPPISLVAPVCSTQMYRAAYGGTLTSRLPWQIWRKTTSTRPWSSVPVDIQRLDAWRVGCKVRRLQLPSPIKGVEPAESRVTTAVRAARLICSCLFLPLDSVARK